MGDTLETILYTVMLIQSQTLDLSIQTSESKDKETHLQTRSETVSVNKHQTHTQNPVKCRLETHTSHAHCEQVLPHSGPITIPHSERHLTATSMFNKHPEAVGPVLGHIRGQKPSLRAAKTCSTRELAYVELFEIDLVSGFTISKPHSLNSTTLKTHLSHDSCNRTPVHRDSCHQEHHFIVSF